MGYSRRPTGKLCEACGGELFEYWSKDATRYKKGGFWYTRCYECDRRKRIAKNPNWYKKQYARRQELHPNSGFEEFGITRLQYSKLLEAQGGVCAICKQKETRKHQNGKTLRLAIDHDHSSGEIRGLLCRRCNIALGLLEDNIDLLAAMQAYLLRCGTAAH